jgi:hypothetical protein
MSQPDCDGPTFFDILVALFEHRDPTVLERFP